KMLAVVVADVAVEGEYQFERCRFGTSPDQLRLLAEWLIQQKAEEVVMESTAQYWKPVWAALEALEAELCKAGRGRSDIGNATSGAGAVQSRATGAQAGFSRCRTCGEAASRTGAGAESRSRC